MASNPLFIIPDFFCIFQKNLAMATLGLKEKVGKKVRPVGCLSSVNLPIGKVHWENAKTKNPVL